jgi:hypothetical protein
MSFKGFFHKLHTYENIAMWLREALFRYLYGTRIRHHTLNLVVFFHFTYITPAIFCHIFFWLVICFFQDCLINTRANICTYIPTYFKDQCYLWLLYWWIFTNIRQKILSKIFHLMKLFDYFFIKYQCFE